MDLDFATRGLAFLTALIFFGSAIISFVNARLNEAKTPEARSNAVNVVTIMLLLLSLGFTAAATAAVYFKLVLVWGLLLFASSGLQAASFLTTAAPVTRIAIVMVAFNIAFGTLAIGVGTTFYSVGLLLDSQRQMIDLQDRTVGSIGALQENFKHTIDLIDALKEIVKAGAAPQTVPAPPPPP
jgi:hypothetical protein